MNESVGSWLQISKLSNEYKSHIVSSILIVNGWKLLINKIDHKYKVVHKRMKWDGINEINVVNDTFNTKWLVLHKDGMIIMDEIGGLKHKSENLDANGRNEWICISNGYYYWNEYLNNHIYVIT